MIGKFSFVISALLFIPTCTFAQTPVPATFNAVNNFGVKQITVDGKNLLTGCGFGFIGSATGTDDTGNITTCRSNNGGVMRPFNGQMEPSLPFNLTFTKGSASNTMLFSGSIGPSKYKFATVSMPMDSVTSFTYWRYAGSSTLNRFDKIATCYAPGMCTVLAPGYPGSGDIIGTDYTIRVTLTSSSIPMRLFFVDASAINVRNVEYSFGGVNIGQRTTVAGKIEVFKTNQSSLPTYVYETESSGYHQIGRRDGNAWSVRVGDATYKFLNYGPYTTILPSGLRTAAFKLLVDNNSANNAHILTIDAFDATTGYVLSQQHITRKMFTSANTYQNFNLPFTAIKGHKIELRTFWRGGAYIKQDSVTIR